MKDNKYLKMMSVIKRQLAQRQHENETTMSGKKMQSKTTTLRSSTGKRQRCGSDIYFED